MLRHSQSWQSSCLSGTETGAPNSDFTLNSVSTGFPVTIGDINCLSIEWQIFANEISPQIMEQ